MKTTSDMLVSSSPDLPSAHLLSHGSCDSLLVPNVASSPQPSGNFATKSSSGIRHRLKRKRPLREEGESDHDQAWHDQYFAEADAYDALKKSVMELKVSDPPRVSEPYSSPKLHGRHKKLYHLYGHDIPEALDIESRRRG